MDSKSGVPLNGSDLHRHLGWGVFLYCKPRRVVAIESQFWPKTRSVCNHSCSGICRCKERLSIALKDWKTPDSSEVCNRIVGCDSKYPVPDPPSDLQNFCAPPHNLWGSLSMIGMPECCLGANKDDPGRMQGPGLEGDFSLARGRVRNASVQVSSIAALCSALWSFTSRMPYSSSCCHQKYTSSRYMHLTSIAVAFSAAARHTHR